MPQVEAVVSVPAKSYGKEIPALQHKVGDIHIDEFGLLYVLLDDAHRLRVFDLDTGTMVADQPLPMGFDGVELRSWEGVTVVRDSLGQLGQGGNVEDTGRLANVWLYLAQDHPAEIWQYNFSFATGFAQCGLGVSP